MACDDFAAYSMMLASTKKRKEVNQIATNRHHHIPKTLNRRERQKQKKKAKRGNQISPRKPYRLGVCSPRDVKHM